MTRYYTDKTQIEDNALKALSMFESESNIKEISVFPDIHFCSERSIPVGVAFKTTDVFYPLITGKDMGCGVAYLRIHKTDCLKPFDKAKHYNAFAKAVHSATDEGLGGGNHFLSLEESDTHLYIIVHTGSRNLGIQMYQENYAMLKEHNPGQEWLPIEFATDKYIDNYVRILDYAKARREEFLIAISKFLVKNEYIGLASNYAIEDSCHNLLDFTGSEVIHRKGSSQLFGAMPVVIPLSMSRGSLIVKPHIWHDGTEESLYSCSHGAGRKLSRTDTLKHWHSMKRSEKESYKKRFSELLNKSGEFDSSIIQEFDFAYKDSDTILADQPYLSKVDRTIPIATVKFLGV